MRRAAAQKQVCALFPSSDSLATALLHTQGGRSSLRQTRVSLMLVLPRQRRFDQGCAPPFPGTDSQRVANGLDPEPASGPGLATTRRDQHRAAFRSTKPVAACPHGATSCQPHYGRVMVPYLCRGPASSGGSGVVGIDLLWAGDARAWLGVPVLCARAPSLTSVHDPRVGSGAGDVMFDGVIPLGKRCGRSVFQGRPRGRRGRRLPGAGRGASG
jgi:hypothetical protein